jgi:phosphoglycolate phosphatase
LKQNFIFDLDGTLVDSLPGPQRRIVDSLKPYIGPPIRAILRSPGQPACEVDLDRMERVFRDSYDTDGSAAYKYSGATKLPGRLAAVGKRGFLVTNKPSKPAENILKALGLYACFESMVMPDSQVPPFRGKEEMLRSLVVVGHGYGHERVSADFLNCRVVPDPGAISALFIENGGAAL